MMADKVDEARMEVEETNEMTVAFDVISASDEARVAVPFVAIDKLELIPVLTFDTAVDPDTLNPIEVLDTFDVINGSDEARVAVPFGAIDKVEIIVVLTFDTEVDADILNPRELLDAFDVIIGSDEARVAVPLTVPLKLGRVEFSGKVLLSIDTVAFNDVELATVLTLWRKSQ